MKYIEITLFRKSVFFTLTYFPLVTQEHMGGVLDYIEEGKLLNRILKNFCIQGDPKPLAPPPPLGRRSRMTWSLSDKNGLKYNLFKNYLPNSVF